MLYAAFGCCVVLGICLGLGIADYSDPIPRRIPYGDASAAKSDYDARRKSSTPDDAISWIDSVKRGAQENRAKESEQEKGHAKNYHDALDLEAQWASASAAERMARLTVWQLFIGLGGIAAVGWSLVYTRKAVNAANRSAEVSERMLAQLERPWIFVNIHPHILREQKEGMDGKIEAHFAVIDISNHGRMPATIKVCNIEFAAYPGRPSLGILHDHLHGVLGPGESWKDRKIRAPVNMRWGANVYEDLTVLPDPELAAGENLFFFIALQYSDVSGKGRESHFCWRYDRGVDYWVRYGIGDPTYDKTT